MRISFTKKSATVFSKYIMGGISDLPEDMARKLIAEGKAIAVDEGWPTVDPAKVVVVPPEPPKTRKDRVELPVE